MLGGDEAHALGLALQDGAEDSHASLLQRWDFTDPVDWASIPEDSLVVICRLPTDDSQWRVVRHLKSQRPGRVVGIQELVLPFTPIEFAQARMDYYFDSLEQIAPYYLGEETMGPLRELNARLPLAELRIIEIGPFDGCQTAALVHAGARHVTCIEARAENAIKTLVASHALGWENVRIVMDDFHNADALRYGRFDLAFAHGVYYHSPAPFFFLENLLTLADRIFVGGFCATDALPASDWETLEYEGRDYRVKRYAETNNFTAGMGEHGFFFDSKDLVAFFTERGCEIEMITDEPSAVTAGNYTRFLASRR